jgi:hypothetical protein
MAVLRDGLMDSGRRGRKAADGATVTCATVASQEETTLEKETPAHSGELCARCVKHRVGPWILALVEDDEMTETMEKKYLDMENELKASN